MTRAVRARRDPAWTADGFVSDRWLPVSPVTGRLDAFTWVEPLAQIGGAAGGSGDVIEAGEELAAIEVAPVVQPASPAPEIAMTDIVTATVTAQPPPSASVPEPAAPPAGARNATPPAPAANFEKLIPLLHAPDDPGPDGEPQTEPAPDPPPPAPNGWDRLRELFK